jgi:hypothetical protein
LRKYSLIQEFTAAKTQESIDPLTAKKFTLCANTNFNQYPNIITFERLTKLTTYQFLRDGNLIRLMIKKIQLLITLAFLMSAIYAQKPKKFTFVPGQIKPALFGIAFNLTDFNAPKNFGKNRNASTLAIPDMSAGVSLTYWKGLTPFIDISASLHGIFHDYSALYFNTPGKTEIGLELEPTIHIRPLKDENIWSPFLTVGLGGGLYTNHMGGYIPLGAGLQFNGSSVTYLFLQAQYKWSISPHVLGNNLFYSIGFAQNIGTAD